MTPLEAGLEAMDKYFATHDSHNKLIIRARCRAMLKAYAIVWEEDNKRYIVKDAEKLLMGPLVNLENMRDSGYLMSGKLDLLLEEKSGRKRTILLDHKVMANGFEDEDIEHLLVSSQPHQYAALGWSNGIKFDAAMWDVVTKCTHVPRKESILKGSPSRIAGRKTTVNGVEYVKGQTVPANPDTVTPGETMEEFEDRVFQVYMENPGKRFARPEVPIIKSNVGNHMQSLYLWTKELDMDSKSDMHLRNDSNCISYGRACSYLGICSGRSHFEDGTWTKRKQVHNELDIPAGIDPYKLITNSRMKMFKECRLKHDNYYNKGLVKVQERIEEPLYVGSAAHIGFEYFWKELGKIN